MEGTDGRALALALTYLNRRERTVAEVQSRLERAELPPAEIHAAIGELAALGMLDDARYARLFTEDKRNLEGWGAERISRSLDERGVAPEHIAAALDRGSDAGEELERALAVLFARHRAPADDRRDRERAFAMLVRKGYDSETAAAAVRRWSHTEAA